MNHQNFSMEESKFVAHTAFNFEEDKKKFPPLSACLGCKSLEIDHRLIHINIDVFKEIKTHVCKACRGGLLFMIESWLNEKTEKKLEGKNTVVVTTNLTEEKTKECERCKNRISPFHLACMEISCQYNMREISLLFQKDRTKGLYFLSICRNCMITFKEVYSNWKKKSNCIPDRDESKGKIVNVNRYGTSYWLTMEEHMEMLKEMGIPYSPPIVEGGQEYVKMWLERFSKK